MNEHAYAESKTECPAKTSGPHEYEVRDGKELACRCCNYVYSPALPANYEEALQSFQRDARCSKAPHGRHVFTMSNATAKADCLYCQLSYADWSGVPAGVAESVASASVIRVGPKPLPDASKIEHHEGKKYLRSIRSAVDPNAVIRVDVYDVLTAFGITCPAVAHAAKKILCAGQRGKGTVVKDLQGAIDALHRAIELQQQREIIPPQ